MEEDFRALQVFLEMQFCDMLLESLDFCRELAKFLVCL